MSSLKAAPQNHISRLPWHLTFLDFCFCWETRNLLPPSTKFGIMTWRSQWRVEGDFRFSQRGPKKKNVKCQVWSAAPRGDLDPPFCLCSTWLFSELQNLLPPSTEFWVALWRWQWRMEGDFSFFREAVEGKKSMSKVEVAWLITMTPMWCETWRSKKEISHRCWKEKKC